MSGLILNDHVEVYHILRPSVKARGRVVRAHQLDCTVEVMEGGEKRKLLEVIDAVYQVSMSSCVILYLLLSVVYFFTKLTWKAFSTSCLNTDVCCFISYW